MKRIIVTPLFAILGFVTFAQVGIGTNAPSASAALDITSTTQGFLPPRMNKAEMRSVNNPAEGLMVYCLDCKPKGIYYYDGKVFISTITSKEDEDATLSDVETAVVEVVSPVTGRVWMDRNLGATQVAVSPTDELSYGDYYQWGRGRDGHEKRISSTSTTQITAGTESDKFTIGHDDWLLAVDNTRWNTNVDSAPKKTKNDPCPNGYRVPTEQEWKNEGDWVAISNSNFNSSLKLPLAGLRHQSSGLFDGNGSAGNYWSSTSAGDYYVQHLGIDGSNKHNLLSSKRANGFSIRCIKEE